MNSHADSAVATPDAVPAFDVVALAASLGGLPVLRQVLAALPANFPAAVVVLQHLSPDKPSHLVELLGSASRLPVEWAGHDQLLHPGLVYVAPPAYHLTVTVTGRFALAPWYEHATLARPSVDLLWESLAARYTDRLIGVVLTGRGRDSARGAQAIKRYTGRVLVQGDIPANDPLHTGEMPNAALSTGCIDFLLPLATIGPALVSLVMVPGAAHLFKVPLTPWALLAS